MPHRFNSMKLLLPGFFLLVLGVGNIWVGLYKGNEYQLVLNELSSSESTPILVNASPLRRIQLAEQTENRLYRRLDKARARRDFYMLVTFGGEVFVALSLVLLVAAAASGSLGLIPKSQRPT